MSRPAVSAFAVLAVATIAAFFLVQHLKVTTPLINGFPAPVPSVINPVSGGTCRLRNPQGRLVPVSFRAMHISFYLQNQPDVVDVAIVDAAGAVIDTLPGSGRYMPLKQRRAFAWDGRESSGRVAPDGVYDIRVTLVHQGRSLLIANGSTGALQTVTVQTHPPDLAVTAIVPDVVATPGVSTVTIHYVGNQGIRPRIIIVRRGAPGRVLKNYAATTTTGTSAWNGTLAGGRPAPAGAYVVGLRMTDRTCDRVRSPLTVAAAPRAAVAVR